MMGGHTEFIGHKTQCSLYVIKANPGNVGWHFVQIKLIGLKIENILGVYSNKLSK